MCCQRNSATNNNGRFAFIPAVILFLSTTIFPVQVMSQKYNPVANSEAIIQYDQVRFTILTPRVIRLEWSEDGQFEDHATLSIVNRNLPLPHFSSDEKDGFLYLNTDNLNLKYKLDSGKLTKNNLTITFTMDGGKKSWVVGMENPGNLKGTTRTLDDFDGDTHNSGKKIELSEGIISRDGWVMIDDSKRPVFDESDWPWVQPRSEQPHQDFYFFAYAYDYKAAMKDFISIAGKIPIPPKFAFGSWWSRYWEYSDTDLRNLIHEFEIHDVPLDVFVVDMDWHITSDPSWYKNSRKIKDQAGESAGWTGFTWNKNYFPNPKKFLDYTEQKGLKVCMNLHPASGIQPHEVMYPQMARAMGIDPATKKYVPFDITNKKFAKNFMEIVLRPMEKEGVDFWWLDWQQWSTTTIPGVNPTIYLNYVFFSDMQKHRKVRPLIFHRYGGLGNNRYVIGFSGDVHITWKSLDYQPWFTSTAANVGFGYWSHDIGGHMRGKGSPEMYTRWIQWGAFSPIFRTHATKNKSIERRIWAYPLPNVYAMREAILQRYALIPYIYSSARKTFETGISICHPLYYDHPKEENAYKFKNEYMFGDDLLIHPITKPMEKDELTVNQKTWLPKGDWIEWSTGTVVKGGAVREQKFTLSETPVYAKAGSIIPMQPKMRNTHEKPVDPLILKIFPGEGGKTVVYDDAGNDENYLDGEYSETVVDFKKIDQSKIQIVIYPVLGDFVGMQDSKSYEIRFPLSLPPLSVEANGKEIALKKDAGNGYWKYNGDELETIVRTPVFGIDEKVTVILDFPETNIEKLSGIPGKLKKLNLFTPFLAANGWPLAEYSKDTVVRAGQLGLRISEDPASAEQEIKQFYVDWEKIKKMLNDYSKENSQFIVYLKLLNQK